MMSVLKALSLTSLAVASPEVAPQVPETVTFVLAATYEATGDRVYLGQVATCRGAARLCEEAYGIDLGAAPAPGKTQTFAVDKLRELLAKEWPSTHILVEATKPLRVLAPSQAISEEAVLGALRDRLVDGLVVTDTFAVDVEKLQMPGGLAVRPGEYRIEFPRLTETALGAEDWVRRHLVGSQRLEVACLPLDAPEDGVPTATFQVNVNFLLKERLPVAARNLLRGESLRAEDLDTAWVERGRSSQQMMTDLRQLIGRRVVRVVAAGEPVPLGAVEVPDVVRRGQLVKLEMRGRGVDVSSRVQVLQAGGYGEAVDAVYPTTKKKIRVRIVDGDTVEFLF